MPNTALNRTVAVLLTNKSGGALTYGAVVVIDTTTASSFTTTTTAALSTKQIGVIIEPAGIANNALGMVATGGYVPRLNLDTTSAIGQFLKTTTAAGQATPHNSPQVEGDFAVALSASTIPEAVLFGSPNGPSGSGGSGIPETIIDAKGDLIAGSAADTAARLAVGSDGQVLTADTTQTTGIKWATPSSSGAIVQVATTQSGAVSTGTTTIPIDDTIPQNTEGTEFMSLAITPTNAANKLKISVTIFLATSAAPNSWMAAALFQDTTANALAVGYQTVYAADGNTEIQFTHIMTAGTTGSTTFKVRAGSNGAGTTTFNGRLSSRLYGGVSASSIVIEEFTP